MWPKQKKLAEQQPVEESSKADSSPSLQPGSHLDGPPDEQLDDEQIANEPTRDSIATVRHRAVRLLARREHGRLELRDKLLQRGMPAPETDIALDELAERGLQCDHRFAESYTRMRVNRGFGANKIRADLQGKRLSRELIEEAIADSNTDWIDNAHSALLKKYGEPDSLSDDHQSAEYADSVRERARMQRFLLSRGYNHSEINDAIHRLRQRVN